MERFEKVLPCPAVFENDANCACFSERDAGRKNYVYLSLNESVGGAIMLNGRLWMGETFQAGELGHMILIPGGRRCYCGKQGCTKAFMFCMKYCQLLFSPFSRAPLSGTGFGFHIHKGTDCRGNMGDPFDNAATMERFFKENL